MDKMRSLLPVLVVIVTACILAAGCTAPDDSASPGTTTAPAIPAPKYTAGDVVKNPSSTSDTAWLVTGYDPAADKYERAIIYPKSDGSWGYRKDDRTEQADRAVMERVYTEIVTHVAPASVPIVTPTTVATVATTRAAGTTAVTTTSAAALKPYIEKVIPDYGFSGTTIKVTDLVGKNFVTGATVSLGRNNTVIAATNVRVVTPTSITCDIAIPAGSDVGAWDVTVKNPDGQSYTFTNIFTVRKDTSVVTTTAGVSNGTIPIDSIDPPVAHIGYYYPYTIMGAKFQNGATVKLQKEGRPDIEASSILVESSTTIRCGLNPPAGSMGSWDIYIKNPDGTWGRFIQGISIQ